MRNKINLKYDLSPLALERWQPCLKAVDADNTISVLDEIGDNWEGTGVTAKRIMAALRSIGDGDVVVNINSPGGDMFEGLAIYSALREHPGKVTVKILSLAASAASVIAMAGDEIQIAKSGFMMIHNAWVFAIGNRHDLRGFADVLEPFDASMAQVYADRTNTDVAEVKALMDAETWLSGQTAIDSGFADAFLPSDQIKQEDNPAASAVKKLDIALAKAGLPRSERRKLLNDFKAATHNAGGNDTHNAVSNGDLLVLTRNLKGIFDHA